MNLTRKEYETKGEKQIDFVLGIVIWVAMNVVFGIGFVVFTSMLTSVNQLEDPTMATVANIGLIVCSVGPFIANIAAIVLLAIYRRWMAFGMLSAIGAMMVLTICAGVVLIGACGAALSGANL